MYNTILFIGIAICMATCSDPAMPLVPTYTEHVLIEDSLLSANAAIADVNGDGLPDIIIATGRHWPGANMVFRGRGDGRFEQADTLAQPFDRSYSITPVDMDRDGDLDLVVSNDRPDPNYVLLNDGTGQFTKRLDFGEADWPTRNSTIADLNNDNRPDVVVANRDQQPEGNNFICLNEEEQGKVNLDCRPIVSGSATTIAVEDMDGDGNLDLIVPYRDQGQSQVYYGNGTGTFPRKVAFGPADASFRAALPILLDSGGRPGLVAIDDRKKETRIYHQTTAGEFREGVLLGDRAMTPYALAIADLDKDGQSDVVVGYRMGASKIFLMHQDTTFTLSLGDSAGTAYGFGIGDVNKDGWPDMVIARSGASDLLFTKQYAGRSMD